VAAVRKRARGKFIGEGASAVGAAWVAPEDLVSWGILLSQHMASAAPPLVEIPPANQPTNQPTKRRSRLVLASQVRDRACETAWAALGAAAERAETREGGSGGGGARGARRRPWARLPAWIADVGGGAGALAQAAAGGLDTQLVRAVYSSAHAFSCSALPLSPLLF
jgi:hypothetical protein